jgi:hypothetical protein
MTKTLVIALNDIDETRIKVRNFTLTKGVKMERDRERERERESGINREKK